MLEKDDINSISYTSENIQRKKGWGDTKYDEFLVPFQWIGKRAEIRIRCEPGKNVLLLYAGSPNFSGTRNLSVTGNCKTLTQPISPGWRAYQFGLGDTNTSDEFMSATISIDKLLDIEKDPRDLGLMIRDMKCLSHELSVAEWKVTPRDRNIKRQVEYYGSRGTPDILWLASYPRSGNSWMRFLLTNLLFEPVKESNTIAKYIDEICDPLYCSRGNSNRCISIFETQPVHIVKTHIPFHSNMPLRDETAGAIYVVRSPLDVAVSIGKYRPSPSPHIDDFLTYGVSPLLFQLQHVSWQSHVYSWLCVAREHYSIPIFVVKYEDLSTDPHAVLRKLLEWLKIERSEDDIERAINNSYINNLKKMESIELEKESPGIFFNLEHKTRIKSGWRFLADGKANNYHNYLNPEQIELGLSTFGPVMKKLGY